MPSEMLLFEYWLQVLACRLILRNCSSQSAKRPPFWLSTEWLHQLQTPGEILFVEYWLQAARIRWVLLLSMQSNEALRYALRRDCDCSRSTPTCIVIAIFSLDAWFSSPSDATRFLFFYFFYFSLWPALPLARYITGVSNINRVFPTATAPLADNAASF